MPLIDAHVHLYPPEINLAPAAWAASSGEAAWARMCTRLRKSTGRTVQAFPSVDQLLHDMDVAGVDRAVLLGWYWEQPANCTRQNAFYADCVRLHPDRLCAFATVQPLAAGHALEEMRSARENGLIGLGELSPHSHGLALHDARVHALLAQAAQWDWPVNLHVTEPESRPYPGRVDTPLVEFCALADAFPQVKLILAHWGGRLWRTPGGWPDNVWVDTAASPLIYGEASAATWQAGLTACGVRRILWGTDYPLELYPSPEAGNSQALFLTEARLQVPHADQDAVCGGNMAHLLRLA